MGKPRLTVLCAGCIALLSGCYRSASLAPGDMARLEPAGDTQLVVQGTDGSRRTFRDYDTVEVTAPGADSWEFTKPVSAQQQSGSLVVTDRHTQHVFHLTEVESVTVSKSAPERPWIIAAATVGAMLLGGFVGSELAGECHDLGCYGNALLGLTGGAVGAGLGLGISIPMTGVLGSKRTEPQRAPTSSEAWH